MALCVFIVPPYRLLWCPPTSPKTEIRADSQSLDEHQKHHKRSLPLRTLSANPRGRASQGEPAPLPRQAPVDERPSQSKENTLFQEIPEDV